MTRIAVVSRGSIKVPLEHVRKNIGLGRAVNKLINIIKPELNRQNRSQFTSVIVELDLVGGQPKKVYFDENADFVIKLKKKKVDSSCEGKNFKELGLTYDDIDKISIPEGLIKLSAPHFFIIRTGDEFHLAFDFRKQRNAALPKIRRAKEFLAVCKKLDPLNDFHICVYNLWSAFELLSDAAILSAGENISTSHIEKMKRLEELKKTFTVVSDDFDEAFRQLANRKQSARYPGKRTDRKWKRLIRRNSKLILRSIKILESELSNNVYFQY